MDFVRSDQLIAAMNSWVLDKQRPLADHLLASGALAVDSRQLLDALVDKHIALHGGRADASLAALSSVEPLRCELAVIPDSDVQQSLGHAAAVTPRGDRHATVVVPSRKPTSPGLRFHILRPHAAGGLGKVSIARDDELNREVALKELHDRHADNPDSRARFLQEAEITGGLEHPGVVPIYGLGQYADGRPLLRDAFSSAATASPRRSTASTARPIPPGGNPPTCCSSAACWHASSTSATPSTTPTAVACSIAI